MARWKSDVATIATVSSDEAEQCRQPEPAEGPSADMDGGCSAMATADQLHEQFIASQRCGRRNALANPDELATADPGAFKLAEALEYTSIGASSSKTASDTANEVSTDSASSSD
uniref:cAMP-dependent protein kinase inhibitor n=2 Tax=Steinernema glaseri TaxID=37863 RepID=A0A1I7YY11_9BILA